VIFQDRTRHDGQELQDRQLGPVTYLVDVCGGRKWKQHVDHIKELLVQPTENEFQPAPPPKVGIPDIIEPKP